jgi:hypothetical protein
VNIDFRLDDLADCDVDERAVLVLSSTSLIGRVTPPGGQ